MDLRDEPLSIAPEGLVLPRSDQGARAGLISEPIEILGTIPIPEPNSGKGRRGSTLKSRDNMNSAFAP
jgi:hypothetical protein